MKQEMIDIHGFSVNIECKWDEKQLNSAVKVRFQNVKNLAFTMCCISINYLRGTTKITFPE